MNSIQEIAAV